MRLTLCSDVDLGECPPVRLGARYAARLLVGLMCLLGAAIGVAQQREDAGLESDDLEAAIRVPLGLLEREPFAELTLDAENGNAVLQILPLEAIPANPKPTDNLTIRLLDEPDQQYDVQWQHIARLRTYEQIIFEDAQRLVAEKKFDKAFGNFDYLLHHSPVTPALSRAVLRYLLENAAFLVEQQDYQHALAVLEEVVRRDPGFQAAEVTTRIAHVADRLIAAEVQEEDFRNARGLIARLEKQYPALRIESLERWRTQLIQEATRLREQSLEKLQQGDYRQAERLSRRMVRIWPDLPGAVRLQREIARRYPMAIVGVAEVAGRQDVTSILSWPARRTGQLTQRTLLQFLGAGPEGGQYLCPLGDYYQSDDRRRLTLRLAQSGETGVGARVDGYDVSQQVLAMADPASPLYDPYWASLTSGTRVEDVFQVHIDLRRPHVLPEAMLQIPLGVTVGDRAAVSPSAGPYLPADSLDEDVHFVVNPQYSFPGTQHPSEIVERYYATSQEAVSALRRGDIDIVDYLFPDDAARLSSDESLTVVPYALPTIHLLIPNYNSPFTADPTVRRAIVYGIDRQAILDAEVLGNNRIAGCQVISGPFPLGTRDNDPLAYAYDPRISPHAYDPRLAAVLKKLAHRSLREVAQKRGVELPGEITLVLGFPHNQVARVACQAISQYLQVIGIQCELRELPPGMSTDPTGDVDLLYVQVAMWEPVIHARRLLAPFGASSAGNEYVGMALRRLDAARNWREARERLHELHRIVHEQVALIPLWQTVDYLVYANRLHGVGPNPLLLYQDVERWQLTTSSGP